jgi:hypothetical protein
MKKIFLYIVLPIIVLVFWLGESRKFYCVDNRYITVWKTYGGTSYVVPRRYYGLIRPSDNFIITDNGNDDVTIYWTRELPNTVIFRSESQKQYRITNKDTAQLIIADYKSDAKKFHDILYKPNAKYHGDIKEGAHFIDIDIFENYVTGKQ